MQGETARRRILLAAGPHAAPSFRHLFTQAPLDLWDPVPAESFTEVRFITQHNPCDIALVHEDLLHQEGEAALGWIARNPEIPVVLLASSDAEVLTSAYRQGVTVCVPRDLSLAHAWLLDAALTRAVEVAEQSRNCRRHYEQLQQCRRHIDRLVNLIWRTSPMEPETHWFTQRHTMERLQEEISRTQRHGDPLTLAVAEVHEAIADCGWRMAEAPQGPENENQKSKITNQKSALTPDSRPLTPDLNLDSLASRIVSQSKRRCDVAGQYGMQGFLLLMVHTPREGGVICCKRLKQLLETAAAETALGPRGPIRAYFGLASSPAEAATAQSLLRSAEQNLEAAKAGKGEGVVAD